MKKKLITDGNPNPSKRKKGVPNAQAFAHANPKASFMKAKSVKSLRGGGGGKKKNERAKLGRAAEKSFFGSRASR